MAPWERVLKNYSPQIGSVGFFYFANPFLFETYWYYNLIFAHQLFCMIIHFLQIAGTPNEYLPIGIQLLFVVGLIGSMVGLSHLLGPSRKTSDKLDNFESGIEQVGNARQPVAIKYFLVAILFVLFDVEVIFFYPYAVNFRELGWTGLAAVLGFVGFFVIGLSYVFGKGALSWED